jgi:hypothetical protein
MLALHLKVCRFGKGDDAVGLLFNSDATLKICAKLNRKFSEEKLTEIRLNSEMRARFDPSKKRTLERVAYKSGLWPGKRRDGKLARRWYKFLKDLRTASGSTHDSIRQALWSGIMDDANVLQVAFTALESPDDQYHFDSVLRDVVDPGDPNGTKKIQILTLQTPHAVGAMADVPPKDTDETNTEPDDPDPTTIEDPPSSLKRQAAKKKATKKKAAKKKAAKKKAAKKKATKK